MSAPERLTLEQALQRAQLAWQQEDFATVERLCRSVLQVRPDAVDALQLLGLLAMRLQRLPDAEALLARAVAVAPSSVEARYNLAVVLHAQKRNEAALAAYTEVIARRPRFAAAYSNRGVVHRDLGRPAQALADYDRALELEPAAALTHNNRGVVLRELRRPAEALASYDRAIAARPDFAEAHCNRGAALTDLGRHAEALASHERAIASAPRFADAWVRRAVTLTDLGDHGAAVESLRRALDIDPARDWLEGTWLHAKMRICDWRGFDEDVARLAARVERGERAIAPFAWLSLCDAPALHRRAAQAWTQAHAGMAPLDPAPARRRSDRLHIGYFSADLHEHATAWLMAGVLEHHDRERFEVTAFSFGPRTGDAMQARIERSVERFVDVRGRSDEEVARLARELHVDIAVDLKGYTDHARSAIFALRAAPIQLNYLGYPGTMAAPFMDAIIADRVVIPEDARDHYSERVAYVAGCYQVNDAARSIDPSPQRRADHGLPDAAFVFCSFNSPHKILPATFDAWMRILGRVPGSVLWLLADHVLTMGNLREEARRRGVDPARLVFAERLPQAAHMARFRLADAFLDTFPYNAHTTASDALWSRVPVVTRMGASFASRVAASLLRTVGLPELVAGTPEAFEEIAVRLATEPGWLGTLRERLAREIEQGALFDPRRHARALEDAYAALAESPGA